MLEDSRVGSCWIIVHNFTCSQCAWHCGYVKYVFSSCRPFCMTACLNFVLSTFLSIQFILYTKYTWVIGLAMSHWSCVCISDKFKTASVPHIPQSKLEFCRLREWSHVHVTSEVVITFTMQIHTFRRLSPLQISTMISYLGGSSLFQSNYL